jgi:HlyD family secretion protein
MRPLYAFAAVSVVLLAMLGVRLLEQQWQLHGPAGGAGVVEGTSVVVASRLAARVATVEVKEGQEVAAGDLLVTLDCTETEATLAEAKARLEAARAQAAAALANANASKRSGLAASAAARAASAQAASLAAARDGAVREANRLEGLGTGVTTREREQARTQADGLDRQAAGAVASRDASSQQAQAAKEQGNAAEQNAAAADELIHAAEATVERAEVLVGECRVVAPAPGFVETLPWHPGELLQPGAIVARLVDIREVKVTFYVPNAEIGKVAPGAAAKVDADAYAGTEFDGTVTTITMNAEFTPRNIQTRSDRDRLVYPVEVTIPNPDAKLRPGMPVQVTLPGTGL